MERLYERTVRFRLELSPRLDHLEWETPPACCEEFKQAFGDELGDEVALVVREGFHDNDGDQVFAYVMTWGFYPGEPEVVGPGVWGEHGRQLKFCPWCGKKIRVRRKRRPGNAARH